MASSVIPEMSPRCPLLASESLFLHKFQSHSGDPWVGGEHVMP